MHDASTPPATEAALLPENGPPHIPSIDTSSTNTPPLLSTAAKHGKHFFEVLMMLTEGRPWSPAIH